MMYKFFSHALLLLVLMPGLLGAAERLRLATTTSTENSGLLAVLHPPFESQYDVKVDVIAVGTGKALKLGENGDVDVVLVHAPAAEIKFVESGFGVKRLPVMHNDFVLLGPDVDTAGLRRAGTLVNAMSRLTAGEASFVSRGDDSGTHKKEMSLWRSAGIKPSGNWYLSVGQGMGAVLKIANDKLAYTLADRGTYLAFRNQLDLEIAFAGADELYNPYHVILMNPDRHPHVKVDLARRYMDFIRSEQGQSIIKNFRIAGEQLFHPVVVE